MSSSAVFLNRTGNLQVNYANRTENKKKYFHPRESQNSGMRSPYAFLTRVFLADRLG